MSFNDTVWNHAVRGESEALLNALSEAPFLLDALDENGQTVLLTACTFGHTETVEMLLSKNPDINVCDFQGNSPLHLLCMEGHENLVKMFLSRPEVNTQSVNKMGQSILHKACIGTKYQWKQNCFHIVLELLQIGFDCSVKDKYGKAPIDYIEDVEFKITIKKVLSRQHDASVCIQSYFRRHAAIELVKLMRVCSVSISAMMHGWIVRCKMKKRNRMVIRIQCFIRMVPLRRRFCKRCLDKLLMTSAVRIRCFLFNFKRNKVSEGLGLKLKSWYWRYKAARNIQSSFRRHTVQKIYKRLQSAIRIQSIMRMYTYRKKYISNLAATEIQRVVRGNLDREKVRVLTVCVGSIKARLIGYVIRARIRTWRLKAIKIQRQYRIYRDRLRWCIHSEGARRARATVRIQSIMRMYKPRCDYIRLITERWRSHNVIKIQSHIRKMIAMEMLRVLKGCSSAIKNMLRRVALRARFKRLRSMTIKIQRFYRSYRSIMAFRCLVTSLNEGIPILRGPGIIGNGRGVSHGSLDCPRGLALEIDASNNPTSTSSNSISETSHRLYVSDSHNHRINVYDATSGTFLKSLGRGLGSGLGQLKFPHGIAFQMGVLKSKSDALLYVSDYSNHRIQAFNILTGEVDKIIGAGPGNGVGQLQYPQGIALIRLPRSNNSQSDSLNMDTTTNVSSISSSFSPAPRLLLFVADSDNNRILVFEAPSGKFSHVIGAGRLHSPSEVTVHVQNCRHKSLANVQMNTKQPSDAIHLYVIDFDKSHRIQVFNGLNGDHLRFVGVGQLILPYGIAVHSIVSPVTSASDIMRNQNKDQDLLYVSDRLSHRIHVLDSETGDACGVLGAGRGKTNMRMDHPDYLMLHPGGNGKIIIFVSEYGNHRVQVFTM